MREKEGFDFLALRIFTLVLKTEEEQSTPKLIESVGFACLEFEQVVQMTSNGSEHSDRINVIMVAPLYLTHFLAMIVSLTCNTLFLELMVT